MVDEETQIQILKDASRILKEIQEEIVNVQAQGRLDSQLTKKLTGIKRDTKRLVGIITNKVFGQSKLTDW